MLYWGIVLGILGKFIWGYLVNSDFFFCELGIDKMAFREGSFLVV